MIRGSLPLRVECAPAFDYARAAHTTELVADDSIPSNFAAGKAPSRHNKAVFASDAAKLSLDLRYVAESSLDNVADPEIELALLDLTKKGHLGPGVSCDLRLTEGQTVTFVLRIPPESEQFQSPASRPTPQNAQELGVPYESASSVGVSIPSLSPIIYFRC